MSENKGLFREKSIDRLSSPEELNDYLRVTNPGIWVMLGSIILLLVALIVWSNFAVIQSYAEGTAEAENGVLSISFNDLNTAQKVEKGMTVVVGDTRSVVSSVGKDDYGNVIAVASTNVPDGTYSVKVGYRQIKVIQLLFN